MQISLDTADLDEVRTAAELGVLGKVTTNPSHMAKAGARDPRRHIQEICHAADVPVSAEVTATATDEMVIQARGVHRLPVSRRLPDPRAVRGRRRLRRPVRRGDWTLSVSTDAPAVRHCRDFRRHNVPTRIIAAALRHPIHVSESFKAGAHICTMSYAVLDQLLHHPLTDAAVEGFSADRAALPASSAASETTPDTPTRSVA